MEVEGEAILVVSAPEVMGVIEASGMAGEPLPMMRTVFFPILDSGSSFFTLILAYMSLLNLVVISIRGTRVKKKKSVCKEGINEIKTYSFSLQY